MNDEWTAIRESAIYLLVICVLLAVFVVPAAATSVSGEGSVLSPDSDKRNKCNDDKRYIDKGKLGGFRTTFGPENRMKVPDNKKIESLTVKLKDDTTFGPTVPYYISVGFSNGRKFYESIEQCWKKKWGKKKKWEHLKKADTTSDDKKFVIKYEASSDDFSPKYIGYELHPFEKIGGTNLATVIINYQDGSSKKIPKLTKKLNVNKAPPNQLKKAPPYSEPAVYMRDSDVTGVNGSGFVVLDSLRTDSIRGSVWWFGVEDPTQRVPTWHKEKFKINNNGVGTVGKKPKVLHKFDKNSVPLIIGWDLGKDNGRTKSINITYESRPSDKIEFTGGDPYDGDGTLLPPNARFVGYFDSDWGYCNNKDINKLTFIGGDGKPCRILRTEFNPPGSDSSDTKEKYITVREYVMMFSRDLDVPGRLDQAQIKSQSNIDIESRAKKKKVKRNLQATEQVQRLTLATDKRYNRYPIDVSVLNGGMWKQGANSQFDSKLGGGSKDKRYCPKGVDRVKTSYMSICNALHNIKFSVKLFKTDYKQVNIIPKEGKVSAISSTAWGIRDGEKIEDPVQGDGQRILIKDVTDNGPLRSCLVRDVDPDRLQGKSKNNPCKSLPDENIIKNLKKNRHSPRFSYSIENPGGIKNISYVSFQKGKYTQISQEWNPQKHKWEKTNKQKIKTGAVAVSHVPDVSIISTNIAARSANIRSEENTSNVTAKEYYVNIKNQGVKTSFWGAISINKTNAVVSQWEYITWRDKTWDYVKKFKYKNYFPEVEGAKTVRADLKRLKTEATPQSCKGTYYIGSSQLSGFNAGKTNIRVSWPFKTSGQVTFKVQHYEKITNESKEKDRKLEWTNETTGVSRFDSALITIGKYAQYSDSYPIKQVIIKWDVLSEKGTYAPRLISVEQDGRSDRFIYPTETDGCTPSADFSYKKMKKVSDKTSPIQVVAVPTEKPKVIGAQGGYTSVRKRVFVKNGQGEPKTFDSPHSTENGLRVFPENVTTGLNLNGTYKQTSALVLRHSPKGVYILPDGGSKSKSNKKYTGGVVASEVYNVSEIKKEDLRVSDYKNSSLPVSFTASTSTVQPVEISSYFDDKNDTLVISVWRMDGSLISRSEARGTIIYNGSRYTLPADGSLSISMSEVGGGEIKFIPQDWWKMPASKTAYISEQTVGGVGAYQYVDGWIRYVLANFVAPAFLVLSFYWLIRRDYFLSKMGFSD